MHYQNDICGSHEEPSFFHLFNSHKSIQLTDLSNLTMTRCSPKDLQIFTDCIGWQQTPDSQYLLRQTFTKIHPSTAMHRLIRCFLPSCLSSWQDKVTSFVQLPLLKWHKRPYGRSPKSETRGMRSQSVLRNWNCALFLGEEGKDIWPVCGWFCSSSYLKLSCLYLRTVLGLTAEPHSVCWLGTVQALGHSSWGCPHAVLPPSSTIKHSTQDVGFRRKYEVKMRALH